MAKAILQRLNPALDPSDIATLESRIAGLRLNLSGTSDSGWFPGKSKIGCALSHLRLAKRCKTSAARHRNVLLAKYEFLRAAELIRKDSAHA